MEMSDLYQLGRRLAEIALEDMGADELGLAPGEFLVLQDLFLNGRSPIKDIAQRTGLAQSRVSTSVRSFTERGWATTSADPGDGRKTLVDLTEDVRAAGTKRRASRADKTLTAALAGAGEDERATLTAALTRLHQLLVADQTPRRFPDAASGPSVRKTRRA
ncbi:MULTISPECIES: MarR family winged helix-turn-helix transcriptional regulator [unclassified Streptomyces]|uniref:MarR family winged helix-turn-helix transcriptional regulator n=1 Tax=unclassified Streptomyces TaxID=2593676 RepID=UPI0038116259